MEKRWLAALTVVVLVGTFLRFNNLDLQEFHLDEAATLTNVSGHSARELEYQLEGAGALSAGEIFEVQKIQANSSVWHSLLQLSRGNPLHPPLYYFLCRIWVGVFGDSIASVRSLSILLGLLLLIAVWNFQMVLFGSKKTQEIGVALAAVSPFIFIVSTTASEYCLWLVLITFSTSYLVKIKWNQYLIFTLLSIYCSLLTLPVLVAHAIYAFQSREGIPGKRQKFFFSVFVVLVCFLPWLMRMYHYWPGLNKFDWMAESVPFWHYILSTGATAVKIFFDADIRLSGHWSEIAVAIPIALFVLIVEILAIKSFIQEKQKQPIVILFGALILMTLLPTIGLDAAIGGKRGLSPRYHIFVFLLMLLVVTRYLAVLLSSSVQKTRRMGAFLLTILVALGLYSDVKMTLSETWWSKSYGSNAYEISAQINAPEETLLLSGHTYNLIAISRYLPKDTRLTTASIWEKRPELHSIKNSYFFRGSPKELIAFENRNPVSSTLVANGLWKIERKSIALDNQALHD